ncbi:hypothetical protein AHF37_05734 [Paragonimus kellicotti]|nr:hypothetical protein AHF37_05734 [Paragonimus kellicotti]
MKTLSGMGGMDFADTVRRMLSFLIHNDLAVSMEWTGAYNKRATVSYCLWRQSKMPWLANRVRPIERAVAQSTRSLINPRISVWMPTSNVGVLPFERSAVYAVCQLHIQKCCIGHNAKVNTS